MVGPIRRERLPEHLDRMYRAAWALCGSPQDAEDLVQEAYARVLARPRVLRGHDELAYLLRVLRNTYLTGLRNAGRRPRTVDLPADESGALRSPLAEPDVAVEQRELLATIAALPDDFREALVAVDIVGVSYREAARALGTSEATITSRLFRARQRVSRALEGERPSAPGEGVLPHAEQLLGFRHPIMRTCVRVKPGHDPARRPRCLLRVGRAAGRSSPARPPGHRRRGSSARGQLRGQGVRRPHGDGWWAGAPAMPPRGRGHAADVGVLGGEQGGVRGVREHDAAGRRAVDRRGVPRRTRAGADLGVAPGDRRAPPARRPRAGRPADYGRGGQDQVPRQGGQRRGEAGRAARCAARRRAGLSPPATGRAALGRRRGDRAQAARPGHPDRRPGRPARGDDARVDARAGVGPAPSRARPQPGPAPGAGGPPSALDGGRSGRSAVSRSRPMRSTPSSSRSSTAWHGDCGQPGASAARSCCGCASETSRAPLARTRCPRRPRTPRRSSQPRAGCWPWPCR